MQKNKKLIALIVVAFAILFGLIYFIFQDEPVKEDVTKPKDANLVTFNGADLNESENGVKLWSVKADKIEYNPKTKDVFLTNLTGTFIKDGVELTITAPRGRMTENHKKLDMAGGVKGTSSEGASFETEALLFDNVKRILTSESQFTYKKDGMTITGDKLEGNMTMETVKAIGNAKLIKEGN